MNGPEKGRTAIAHGEMNLLAIRLARLGDVILLLPTLAAIAKSTDARVTLLTDSRIAPIARLCPAIADVVEVDRVAIRDGNKIQSAIQLVKLVSAVRRPKFDTVIDFHSFRETNLLALLSGAKVRLGLQRSEGAYLGSCFNRPPIPEDKSIHVSQMFHRIAEAALGGTNVPSVSQVLHIPEAVDRKISSLLPTAPRVTLYVDAPVRDRRWPPEHFAALADYVLEELHAEVLVISSSSNRGLAQQVRRASQHPEKVQILTELTLQELAAAIRTSTLLVSNDTGPMHLGPVLGVPTVGLFSVGLPEHYRPFGGNDRYLRKCPMEDLPACQVIQEVNQLWLIAGRGLQR